MKDLEEMLNEPITAKDEEPLYTKADVDVVITKDGEEPSEEVGNLDEDRDLTGEEYAAKCKKEAMDKLSEYEELENKKIVLNGEITKAQQELEALFSKVRAANLELVNKIEKLNNEFEVASGMQDKLKEELLPLQKEIYLVNNDDKTLIYNKIQSTFVAATVKNQFDLKKFKEEQEEFWKEHLDTLKPYAKFTDVSAYLKITVKS